MKRIGIKCDVSTEVAPRSVKRPNNVATKKQKSYQKQERLTEFITQLPVLQSDPVLSTSSVSVLEDAVEEHIETSGDISDNDNSENAVKIEITDVAFWPDKPTREVVDKWAARGSSELQNLNDDLFKQKSVCVQTSSEASYRICTSQMFCRRS